MKEGKTDDFDDDYAKENEKADTTADDLAPYLPDVNSIESSQILETCVTNFEIEQKDPTEVESFENDDVSSDTSNVLDFNSQFKEFKVHDIL